MLYVYSSHNVHFSISKMPKLAGVGLYSSWGCNQFWSGVVLLFEGGEVLFKSGVVFTRIRYLNMGLLS